MSIKYLNGTIKWHKNKELDKYGKRTLDLYMDQENWDKFKTFDLALKVRTNEETGEKFITLNRKKIGYNTKGEYELGPWLVVDSADKPYDGEVWNGSQVMVKLDVYYSKTSGSNVARVEGVRVENLAEAPNLREPDEEIERPF